MCALKGSLCSVRSDRVIVSSDTFRSSPFPRPPYASPTTTPLLVYILAQGSRKRFSRHVLTSEISNAAARTTV